MDQRRVYLMRHGETLYQQRGTEKGLGSGVLTERGQEQIASAALLFRGVPLDGVYTSPLERAHETARIVAREKKLDVTVSPELREITPSQKVLADLQLAEIVHKTRQYFQDPNVGWDDPYLGGESFRDVQRRGVRFLDSLLRQDGWRTVLVVAHGGINSALLTSVAGVSDGRIFTIEQDFGCINVIDLVDGRPILRLANFTLYDQLKINLRDHSLDIIYNLLRDRGILPH